MTSVPNHQPLLNGSKFIYLLLFLLFFTSCDPSKKGHKTKYPTGPRPETGQTTKPKEEPPVVKTPTPKPKEDTVPSVKVITPERDGLFNERTAKVALLLPFLGDHFSETTTKIHPKSDIALQFYAGFSLAMEEASFQDVPIDINVLDTKASYGEILQLMDRPDVKTADIIIGPYRKRNAALVAQKVTQNDQIMISPFRVVDDAALAEKGHIIQSYAGLDMYMEQVLRHLIKTRQTASIVVVKRKNGKDDRAVASLAKAYRELLGEQTTPLTELEVDASNLSFDDLDIKEILNLKPNTVFIIPTWKDANYLSSILRKIYVSRSNEGTPTIVGMPKWLSFDNMDFSKLNSLNALIPSADIQVENAATKNFSFKFFSKYGTLPTKNAYKGFDTGRYLVQLVQANQTSKFNVPNSYGLFMDYRFDNTALDGTSAEKHVYKNENVKIYKLENFRIVE